MLRLQDDVVVERRRRRRRIRRVCTLSVLAVAALAAVVVFRRPLFQGNLGAVDPGRVYRCAQPDGNLVPILDACRPASVLNLRGGSDDDRWYTAEVRATQERHIDFYDLPLSPTRRPTRRELLALLDVLGRCRYPLLIHCKSGADRTGLASGLYLMLNRGVPPEQALGAFSVSFGHIPLGGPEHLHEPFLEYAAWLKEHGLAHSPERLRAWVEHDYQAADPAGSPPSITPGPRSHSHRHGGSVTSAAR